MNKAEINKLVVRAQNGDRSAFEELYNEFRDRVFFFAKRTTGNADAAEDITSETFVKALESIGTLRVGESFVGWLYTIAYNLCMAQLRDNSHIERFGSDEAQTDAVESAALREPVMLPEDYAVSAETKRKLGEIIDSLSPDMRSAVILYYYEEQTIPEVAKALGTNEHNASQKLYKAKKRIRKGLEKVFGKGALLAAVPMEALLRTTEEAGYVKAAAVGAKVAGLGIGAKIAAFGAAAVIAVGVPIGLYKLGESKGDYRPNEIKESNDKQSRTALDFTGKMSFTDNGAVELNDDSILYYYDFISGLSTPICSKPNCKHEGLSLSDPEPSCDGYVPGINTSCIAVIDNSLYFLYTPDQKSNDYAGFFHKSLCKAKTDGTERTVIAELTNAQSVTAAYYNDNCLAVAYSNTFDEKGEDLTESQSYFSIIDLSSGDIITSDLKEGYQGQIRNVYLSGDKLYYSYFYLAEDIDYSKWDTASAEFEEYINSINRTEIKCFDVKTKEETQLWTGSGSCECMDYGYTVVKEKCPIAIRLADNKQSMLDKTYNNCRFTIDETGIIVSDYDSYKYSVWDPETNETKETATYNKDDYLTFTAVTDSLYFVSYYTEDDYALGYIKKEDFQSGDLTKVIRIKFYNK